MNIKLIASFTPVLLAACDPLATFDGTSDVERPECQGAQVNVSGVWTLSGEGRREGCAEDRFNTDLFELTSLRPLRFEQVGEGVFLDDAGLPLGFRFEDGRVQGACVSFQTREDLDDGGSMALRFSGALESSGRIEGDLTGDGPGDCQTTGRFVLRRSL